MAGWAVLVSVGVMNPAFAGTRAKPTYPARRRADAVDGNMDGNG